MIKSDMTKRFICKKHLICAMLVSVFISQVKSIEVTTKLGKINGFKRTVLGTDLYEFRKIPYARAPVGRLRFHAPLPYGSWNTTLDGTMFGPSCIQDMTRFKTLLENKNVSEDCLHLNIQVPFGLNTMHNKSVMVWIHGGGYTTGQGTFYDASRIAVTGNVIVVTINYRLNIFGFLSMDGLEGNYGLRDQIMALHWVKENIASFGGNSESITIFGESAGGFSVGLLSIIPSNRGLFHRAILQSGVAISPYAIGRKTKMKHVKAVEYVNCSDGNAYSQDIIECLRDVTADSLLRAFRKIMLEQKNVFTVPFAPIVDGTLLPDEPTNLLQDFKSEASSFYRSLDIVIGTVSGEASLFCHQLEKLETVYGFDLTEGIPKVVLTSLLAPQISSTCCNSNSEITAAIIKQYGFSPDKTVLRQDILNAFSDFTFDVPAIQSLRLHSNGSEYGTHFQYVFLAEPPIDLFGPLPGWFNRSEHGAELLFQFVNKNLPLPSLNTSLSRKMSKYWTNFAKTGDVNGQGLSEWLQYDSNNGNYIKLDNTITSGQHLYGDRAKFWLTDVPAKIDNTPSSGYCVSDFNRRIVFFLAILTLFDIV